MSTVTISPRYQVVIPKEARERLHEATLWTQDSDFEAIEGVEYRPKA